MVKKQNTEKKPITVKIDPRLKQELANYAEHEGIPQVRVLEDALANYKHALTSNEARFKRNVPRIKGTEKAIFTARIDKKINDELNFLCEKTLKTKSYLIENAIFWKLYVTDDGTLNRDIDKSKRGIPELPKKLAEGSTGDQDGEKPDDKAGERAENTSAETGTEESKAE